MVHRFKEHFVVEAERHMDRLFDMCEFDGVENRIEPYILDPFSEAVGVAVPREETLALGEMRFNQRGPENALYQAGVARAQPFLEWFEESVKRGAVLPGDGCSFFTGTTMPVDGGLTLHHKWEASAEGQLAAVATSWQRLDG